MVKYRTLEFKLQRLFCARRTTGLCVVQQRAPLIVNKFAQGVYDLDLFREAQWTTLLLQRGLVG